MYPLAFLLLWVMLRPDKSIPFIAVYYLQLVVRRKNEVSFLQPGIVRRLRAGV